MQTKYLYGVGVVIVLLAGFGGIMYYGRPIMDNDDLFVTVSPEASVSVVASAIPTPLTEQDDENEGDADEEQAVTVTSETVVASDVYTMSDVVAHGSPASCWTVISGTVYDLTSWIARHPGGSRAIESLCGQDGTSSFERKHGSSGAAKASLALLKVGTLQ